MRFTQIFTTALQRLKRLPQSYWIIGGVLIVVLFYSFVFLIPRKVDFSYAGTTCVSRFVLFPSLQTPSSDAFTVTTEGDLTVGSFHYAATKVCMTPKEAPASGEYAASIGLLGGWFMAHQFSVHVPEPPYVLADTFVGKQISTALPLKIALTGEDAIHQYSLEIADKIADCDTEATELICDIPQLKLKPGATYEAALSKQFKDTENTVLETKLTTLRSIKLKKSSIADGKMLYDMPKTFTFTFDKPVNSAEVALEQQQDKAWQALPATTQFDDGTLRVAITDDLARKATFKLTITQAIAEDGSSLAAPFATTFTTSGGPKPKSVSVGSVAVARNASIVVKFDQPIDDTVDIQKFAHIQGTSGTVTKRSKTEVVYTLRAGLCDAFRLVLDKGMASATNNEVSDAWHFDGRTVCGTSSVIGYSTQGRAISAYYFGSGSKTILFTGGMHGSEPSGYSTMQAWVNYLMAYGNKIPGDKRVIVVPNTNPDGIAAGSRNSATNVNIDRNFPTANWKADIDTANGTLKNGGGKTAGSEPETKALMALTRRVAPRLEVSFHAQGRLVGANKYGDSVAIGKTYASIVGYQTMFYNPEAVMGYSLTGEYEDWMGEEMGIPAILIELPSPGGNYLSSQLPALLRMLAV